MASFARSLPKAAKWTPLQPRVFSNTFKRIGSEHKVEEENLPRYKAFQYYPVRIGEVFESRYQVVGKLGFGTSSTIWLARDLNEHNHVVLKVFTRPDPNINANAEVDHYKTISRVMDSSNHPGRFAIRTVLDNFKVAGPDGKHHHCLVHPPLWMSARAVLHANPLGRFPPLMMAPLLRQVFLALDFLHTECRIIHTDIKSDNIVYSMDADDPILEELEKSELERPTPRKEVEPGRFIYLSRNMPQPKSLGLPVLCDFGAAIPRDRNNIEDVQPDAYRSSEMILRMRWDCPIDIWNVGCMVWDLCQGGHLFQYIDKDNEYFSKVHLASIISLLGAVPPEMVERCTVKNKFFNEKGEFDCDMPVPPSRSWDQIETTYKDEPDREKFLLFMRKMIEWVPEKRATAAELVEDDWIVKHTSLFG